MSPVCLSPLPEPNLTVTVLVFVSYLGNLSSSPVTARQWTKPGALSSENTLTATVNSSLRTEGGACNASCGMQLDAIMEEAERWASLRASAEGTQGRDWAGESCL